MGKKEHSKDDSKVFVLSSCKDGVVSTGMGRPWVDWTGDQGDKDQKFEISFRHQEE